MTRRTLIVGLSALALIVAGAWLAITGSDVAAFWAGLAGLACALLTLFFDWLDHEPPSRPGYPAEARNRRGQ